MAIGGGLAGIRRKLQQSGTPCSRVSSSSLRTMSPTVVGHDAGHVETLAGDRLDSGRGIRF